MGYIVDRTGSKSSASHTQTTRSALVPAGSIATVRPSIGPSNPKPEIRNPKQILILNDPRLETSHPRTGFGHSCLGASSLFRISGFGFVLPPDTGNCRMHRSMLGIRPIYALQN